ncbi:VOC family protein [Novosphingobium panipatense]|uniref:Glyoxalase superfamily enzyme, possibly 3-demethylubiquinone-9 3-methyltransferase n=1 Tax=Novosphingobium panipatense TaxID=428991 RepID=A0ABY1QR17_9SPHN|nr:VOC family protein [Novosphingobium panipatense]SMP78071.1 Glyoxalase superfamily enzyme, possibly 3-demethylubiquinone-9 3-methyltransferase [Novosphingobium panipatense]
MHASPFLMFQGDAQDALMLWKRAFASALEVTELERHGSGEFEGRVSLASFTLGGTQWRVFDSAVPHAFTFTPATSILVDCDEEGQLRHAASVLGQGGKVIMPLSASESGQLFTWICDIHGVSWQLRLPFPAAA